MNNFLYSSYKQGNHKVIKILGLKFKIQLPPPSLDEINWYLLHVAPHIYLPALEIHLSEHCNLNCQSCSHFSTIAEPDFMPIEQFEKDLKRLSSLTKKIGFINIMGGEPLLNPKCTEYTEITRKYFPDVRINLITNGILLPLQNDLFYEKLAKNNIVLAPTKYPIKINWDKIKNLCAKYKVKLEFYNGEKVLKTSYKIPLDVNGKQNERISHINCIVASCIQLYKGRIYKCPICAYIRHFNKYFNQNFEVTENDYIDIYKIKNIQEVLDFISKPIPFCKYCATKETIDGTKWQISCKNIKEWIR